MARAPISVKFETKSDLTPLLKKALKEMGNSYVTVGVHSDAGQYQAEPGQAPAPVAKVALWLEHGTQHMPARPFMAPTIAAKHAAIQRLMAEALARVAILKEKPIDGLRKLGFHMQVWIQNTIDSNVGPVLTERYLKRRKVMYPEAGNRTLKASGLLFRSIRYVLFIAGKKVDDHKRLSAEDAAVVDTLQARKDARTAGKVDLAARKAQRAWAKANPVEAKLRFESQRRHDRLAGAVDKLTGAAGPNKGSRH